MELSDHKHVSFCTDVHIISDTHKHTHTHKYTHTHTHTQTHTHTELFVADGVRIKHKPSTANTRFGEKSVNGSSGGGVKTKLQSRTEITKIPAAQTDVGSVRLSCRTRTT